MCSHLARFLRLKSSRRRWTVGVRESDAVYCTGGAVKATLAVLRFLSREQILLRDTNLYGDDEELIAPLSGRSGSDPLIP